MAPSKYPMVSVEEAVGAVMDAVAPLEPERVPLVREAGGLLAHGRGQPAGLEARLCIGVERVARRGVPGRQTCAEINHWDGRA